MVLVIILLPFTLILIAYPTYIYNLLLYDILINHTLHIPRSMTNWFALAFSRVFLASVNERSSFPGLSFRCLPYRSRLVPFHVYLLLVIFTLFLMCAFVHAWFVLVPSARWHTFVVNPWTSFPLVAAALWESVLSDAHWHRMLKLLCQHSVFVPI